MTSQYNSKENSDKVNKRAFAIGDIQGCYDEFMQLLDKIKFEPSSDELWIAGDLINRGPKSLETLNYIYSIKSSVKVVLGNHDLHFLAVASGARQKKKSDSFNNIFEFSGADNLIHWLQQQPLIHHDQKRGYAMVHAGIPPQWDISTAKAYADEVQQVLTSEQSKEFYEHMYGNHPDTWSDSLVGMERLRTITNYFTRMRFCTKNGQVDLINKHDPTHSPSGYKPWFEFKSQLSHEKIIFGHWASLMGKVTTPNIFGVDTGCVWGEHLTALKLDSDKCYRQKSNQVKNHK